MPVKRKRDLEDFDPNKSDPEDENFDPGEARVRRGSKRSRSGRAKSKSHRKGNTYRGSDIDDDEGLSSEEEDSFVEDFDDSEDEKDEAAPLNAAGRRARKAAVARKSYRESSGDDISDLDADDEDVATPRKEKSKVIHLNLKKKDVPLPPSYPSRRSTRARTEEAHEELVELSNSGHHAVPTRSSKSKSPETALRATRSSRGMKGLKKAPETIEEATQESSVLQSVEGRTENPDAALSAGQDDEEMAEADPEDHDGEDELAGEDPVPQPPNEDAPGEPDEDDDDMPVTRRTRSSRNAAAAKSSPDAEPEEADAATSTTRRLTRRSTMKKSAQEPSSDFEPGDESAADEVMSNASAHNPDDDDFASPTPRGRRSTRNKGRPAKSSKRGDDSADDVELDQDELAEELHELRQDSRPRRRRSPSIIYQEREKRRRATAKQVDYYMPPLVAANFEDDAPDEPIATPARRRGGRAGGGAAWERPLNTTFGPFGGGGAASLLGGPWGTGAAGGVESDSSDDEMTHRSKLGGNIGMTPTSAAAPGLIGAVGQPLNVEGLGGVGATPNVGKMKNQKAFADADPLGVNPNVDFSQVGGLQSHIDQLKEMVQLPLLYPELFMKFHVTPPRGVLFHGPPGTGKTLLARALANSVTSGGKKISFYMRKGADALSKWVGEAEKQLRLLFEEARRTQPSIIFFDEIDGLAPVRSSKQEQIHASIVSTLLALMDGMDGRGQVIVIGATNRPDNIDPALRRPGRFDREFYFPLPDKDSRRSILDIHTKDWGLSGAFMDELAKNTKGYGGADLRALCTEAALNSIQRVYPQIYSSKEKLIVEPDKIAIHATDFMLSIKNLVPSSERSASSSASPLPKSIEPLLREQLAQVRDALDSMLPRKKKLSALEEAMFEPYDDADHGFGRESLNQEFERSRIFRPRLLISGPAGMGQSYLASAVLHYFEGVHVQNLDLASLLGDGRSPEQVLISQFIEIKRHKPSVIFIPNIDVWYETLRGTLAIVTFQTMLKSIAPTDPILLLATAERDRDDLSPELVRDFFGFSRKNRLSVGRPSKAHRREYFSQLISHVRMAPSDFPDPLSRKKRLLEVLPVAPAPPAKVPSKMEMKALQKRDRQLLNVLKVQLQPIMDQINRKYKKFRQPVIPFSQLQHLYAESDPNYVRPDVLGSEVRPYEITKDKHGNDVLKETATGKVFYNLETTTIEERLSNGFYARPRDFLFDIKTLARDSKNVDDKERTLKANELVSNVEVDVATIESNSATVDWEALYQRQLVRAREAAEKERKRQALQTIVDRVQSDVGAGNDSDSQGPVTIGETIPGSRATTTARFRVMSPASNGLGSDAKAHPLSNGASKPPGEPADVEMTGTTESALVQSDIHPMQPPSQWPRRLVMGAKSSDQSGNATVGTGPLSQRSAVTSVPVDMSPTALENDASTTKTSDPSNKSSGNWTQVTNGFHDSNPVDLDNSQMPDTQPPASQGTSSGEQWPHSQAQAMARGLMRTTTNLAESPVSSQGTRPSLGSGENAEAHRPSIGTVLNDTTSSSDDPPEAIRNSGGSSGSQQLIVIQEGQIGDFINDLTEITSGCTIEQLEQMNRELMDEIWKSRNEWNRVKVLGHLRDVFNDTIRDIENMQGLWQQSQITEESN